MSNSFLKSEVQRNRDFEVGWKDQSIYLVSQNGLMPLLNWR